ncbi:branched-chain amino acid ABC transporter permease [Bradyrhizobium sp. Pear77]|uniref:branched-chain amino acid ABC transporter permease n=1 Tax=Bradyrhizobium TaxID=374 RepID=UPI001E2F07EB|nr:MULTISPECIES: branched-chain amino acid ABC transporter permease [Bradyrhizobium]MCC8954365.1 branched-chain amino acid ABC transporter permease [Bradyrhizobium altum]MCC8964375.1 branched-chain amino acid ABC transporter permease [Bradyrhizobium oropedii]
MFDTLLFLLVDGITNGAVYGLVALSLIVIYTVTRVVNIAQGEYVTLGALSFSSALSGSFNLFSWLVAGGLAAFALLDLADRRLLSSVRIRILLIRSVWIAGVLLTAFAAHKFPGSYWLAVLAALAATVSLGTLTYRLTVEPVSGASPIVLLIVSVGVYMVFHGVAVLIWGAEPQSVPPVVDGGVSLGPVFITYQSLWICGFAVLAMAGLYMFSERTLIGQALQATAVNRVGAQLCGIPVRFAGQLSFAIGAGFSAVSGLLLAPLITANYDMGFPIGLKGFVAAALGGIVEYPTALVGVVLVGLTESFSAFQISAFRDVIVFLMVIPILLWRNAVRPPEAHEH